MIIATRTLSFKNGADIAIKIHAPEPASMDWICRFEIEWPGKTAAKWAGGVDAVQALIHALQMIGAEIYTSDAHEAGKLKWFEPNAGYGFPVPSNIRDLLEGDDATYL